MAPFDAANDSVPPCAWWDKMLTIGELQRLCSMRFEIPLSVRSLGKALSEIGVRPSHIHFDRRTGLGRVGYYDPIVCWAVLIAHETAVPRNILKARFADALQRASEAVWQEFDGDSDNAPHSIAIEWDWRCQSTAVHLFISDPRHGLSPLSVIDRRHQRLHQYTLDSHRCLARTLTIYSEELSRLLAVQTHEQAAALTSDEARSAREQRILDALDQCGVLRACDRRLGPAPCATGS